MEKNGIIHHLVDYVNELPKKAGQQLIMLCQVKKVNGLEVDNLKHLCGLVEDCSSESLRFDLDDDSVIALNYQSAKVAISRILKRHRITVRTATSFLFHRQSARRTQHKLIDDEVE
ncbi:hypothetical protein NC653_025795 [Populus alba x Populus x berolinensis]|uniref:Protease Do-like PDZ domain-containing protein n=1 Tax=Populus alba x Populus x berolinensis TaxID=444605 RepID=A0AAD6MC92_9ROSI|nr:hypothetical protein NC653_025795 [Populus alba x Populus x berolinensis]